ncbi:MAG: phosphatase PAP2 family protein [Marinicella sp.]
MKSLSHSVQTGKHNISLFWTFVPITLLFIPNLFILFSFDVQFVKELYTESQINWFIALNHQLNQLPAYFWTNITKIGEAMILLPMVFLFTFSNRKAWTSIIYSIPVASLLSVALKRLSSVPRPAAIIDHSEITIIGKTLIGHTSLPSGHTITIFACSVAVLMSLYPSFNSNKDKMILGLFLFLTVMISLSRVAVGAHWPLDLIIGAACGWVAGQSGVMLQQRFSDKTNNWKGWRCFYIILFSLFSLALLIRLLNIELSHMIVLVSFVCSLLLVYKLIKQINFISE